MINTPFTSTSVKKSTPSSTRIKLTVSKPEGSLQKKSKPSSTMGAFRLGTSKTGSSKIASVCNVMNVKQSNSSVITSPGTSTGSTGKKSPSTNRPGSTGKSV